DPCTISSIAGDLDIDPATVVRTVDSLEKRGLVKRRRSREDRRQVFVEFTDAGCAADRKSTRLNSSHSQISYAVFCLKKKNRGQSGLETYGLFSNLTHYFLPISVCTASDSDSNPRSFKISTRQSLP